MQAPAQRKYQFIHQALGVAGANDANTIFFFFSLNTSWSLDIASVSFPLVLDCGYER